MRHNSFFVGAGLGLGAINLAFSLGAANFIGIFASVLMLIAFGWDFYDNIK